MDNGKDIPVLHKAIRLLTAIATDPQPAGPSRLAKRLGIAQATCYRIVYTYEQAGWIRRQSDGGYELAPALAALLDSLRPHRRLAEIAQPLLRRLSSDLGLTLKLCVRSGDDAVTIARVDPPSPMLVTGGAGTCFHLCYGSSGAAVSIDLDETALNNLTAAAPREVWNRQQPRDFLARVQDCRRKGYCVDRGSYHPDVHSVSVPLLDAGAAAGTFSALALPNDLPQSRIPQIAAAITKAAKECMHLYQTDLALEPHKKEKR